MQNNNLQKHKDMFKELIDRGHYTREIQQHFLERASFNELSIYINNLCNLNCKHCSCGFPSGTQYLHSKELSTTELVNFIDKNLSSQENSIVAFAGREPFFNNKILDVLQELDKLVGKGSKFRYGIVSNGTRIQSYFSQLKENKHLNWVDISLDGDEKTHDSIRGEGVYNKAVKSLKELINKKIVNYVGISTCCHKDNYKVLPTLFENLYSEIGLKNICILPYVYTGKNEEEFLSSKKEFSEFFKKLIDNEVISRLPLTILFDFEWFTIPFVQELHEKGLFSIEDLKLDGEGTPYVIVKNGESKFYLKFTLLESNKFFLFPDGYFGTMFLTETKNYWKLATCNIREGEITDEVLKETLRRQFEHINKNLKQNREVLISEI